MVSRIFNKIKRILYSTYMCIRYPFLYPRNRFTDRHKVNVLGNLIYNLHHDSTLDIGITGKLIKEKPKFCNKYISFLDNSIKLDTNLKILFIKNKIDDKVHSLVNLMWKEDKFEIVDMDLVFALTGRPIIRIHFKTKDENDTSNYGFSYERVELITNKFKYRLYKIIMWIDSQILDRIFILPTYTEWDAMPVGWNKAFGKQYLKDLKKQLKKDKMLYKFRIMDLKEKYGTARLYINYGSPELYNIINKYESLSWNTCIQCGKPATYTSKGWIAPYCEECVNNSKDPSRYIKRENKEETEHNNV